MNYLRGVFLGLVAVVPVGALVLVAGMAADFISARIATRLDAGGITACLLAAMILPGVLVYASARSAQLVAVPLVFVPAVACVFVAPALTMRGPVGELLRAGLGRRGVIVVAVTTFSLAGLGGWLGFVAGRPRADRRAQK